jgi:hypothetical protein
MAVLDEDDHRPACSNSTSSTALIGHPRQRPLAVYFPSYSPESLIATLRTVPPFASSRRTS